MHTNRIAKGTALALVALIATAAACEDAGPLEVATVPESDAIAAFGAGHGLRPLTERSSGILGPVGPCAAGVAYAAQGSGNATHIGRFDIDLTWCLDPATGAITSGGATVVAANGDRMTFDVDGQAASPGELDMHFVIVGGTGRFADASGYVDVVALVGATGSWTSEGTGWMSY